MQHKKASKLTLDVFAAFGGFGLVRDLVRSTGCAKLSLFVTGDNDRLRTGSHDRNADGAVSLSFKAKDLFKYLWRLPNELRLTRLRVSLHCARSGIDKACDQRCQFRHNQVGH